MNDNSELDEVGQAVMAAINKAAETDWDASKIICSIESIRQDTGGAEISTEELRLLARTLMEPEEIAAGIFFIRDGHQQGVPLQCYGPPGLRGVAICDFVYDKKTNTMKMVPNPSDIAHLDPLSALKLAIQLKYVRTERGVWKYK